MGHTPEDGSDHEHRIIDPREPAGMAGTRSPGRTVYLESAGVDDDCIVGE
ncbi:MAG: hypothetical protein QNL12_16555 [Acidimicrobiia bacterium]|nr:hypothetical protein [Acidimicrobiia bacterium]MDX2468922.1 hypothetical protein [Acidimicrobiia bacterium]